MNCPKCSADTLFYAAMSHVVTREACSDCGWESEPISDLVEHSPAYRLAQLQAQGAAPGWYGPDGKRAKVMSPHPSGWGHRIEVMGCAVYGEAWEQTVEMARLCGFVEVPHG